ncbi:hypothetical protein AVEN_228635-1 [Araneus ventricosus]|uniref:Uncharacterized protein n=1 Tax=Araneus ventricosus TaxID=182803 RepID=A0A4Y2H1Y9_ARAVE|nr:hypothetical protein AVEN_228635-1 [Araneus ventricosus]
MLRCVFCQLVCSLIACMRFNPRDFYSWICKENFENLSCSLVCALSVGRCHDTCSIVYVYFRGIVVWQMGCVYYCFMKCGEFSFKYGVDVVEFNKPLVCPDVIGQDTEGSLQTVWTEDKSENERFTKQTQEKETLRVRFVDLHLTTISLHLGRKDG